MRQRMPGDRLLFAEDYDAQTIARIEVYRDRRGIVFAEFTAKLDGGGIHRWCEDFKPCETSGTV